MMFSVLLLSAGVVSTPVFISEVKAAREAGHLRVEVNADGGIDPEIARTMIDDGRLFIYLPGTRVKADNRAWDLEDGTGEIRAHRHRTETELVVPLDGNGCAGPVELAGSKSGITALVGCDETIAVAKPRTRGEARHAPAPAPARHAGIAEDVVETRPPVIEVPEEQQLRALVALAPVGQTPAAVVAPTPLPTTVPALIATTVPKTPSSTVAEAPRTSASTPAVALAPSVVGSGPIQPAPSPSGGSLRVVGVPALLLGALAVAAYLFARRRKVSVDRQIQIMETASLGPKRSLIVARVGDETLILGTSEAGITLLKSTAGTGAALWSASDAAAESAKELSQPIEEALADIPEPGPDRGVQGRSMLRTIEGGLGALFAGRGVEGTPRAQVHEDISAEFDDLLEDSVEDQELRQKLAAGMSARVR